MYRGRNNGDNNEKETEQQRKLFLGGLALSTTEDQLREYFQQWGTLVDAVVMKDRHSNRSRGFGFVTYASPEMVDEAQSHRPHQIEGRTVESKRAMPREDSQHPESHMTVNKLFVGALKKEITSDHLRQYFSQFGNVVDCEIMLWKETGEPRGFGFVTFDDYDPVDKILVTKPHYINSNRVEVKKALTKEQISDNKRRQDIGRDPYPVRRMGDRFDRMSRGDFAMMDAVSRYDSLMRGPDPWMQGRYSAAFGQGNFGAMGGWFNDALNSRGGNMRDMDFGDYGNQRRFGGGPMRGESSFRNTPYKGSNNGFGRR